MTPPSSKYGPLHALAAGAVLVYTVLANGFAAFWHQFLHGMDLKLTEENILPLLCTNTLLFGGLFLILWVSTFFGRARSPSGPHGGRAVAPRPPPVGFCMLASLTACSSSETSTSAPDTTAASRVMRPV